MLPHLTSVAKLPCEICHVSQCHFCTSLYTGLTQRRNTISFTNECESGADDASMSICVNSSLHRRHAVQTTHRPGSRSDQRAASTRHDHFLSTAAESHSAWHRRNWLVTRSTAPHLQHTHTHTCICIKIKITASNAEMLPRDLTKSQIKQILHATVHKIVTGPTQVQSCADVCKLTKETSDLHVQATFYSCTMHFLMPIN